MDSTSRPGGAPADGPGRGAAPPPHLPPAYPPSAARAPYPPYPPYAPYPPPPAYARPPARAPAPAPAGASRAVVWTAAGMAALVSVVAAAAAVVLALAQAAAPADPAPGATGPDLAADYAPELTERPVPVDVDVADHPFYALDMPDPVDCPVPDLDASSDASWEVFSDELGSCLNDLWRPRLEELGLTVPDPTFATTDSDPDELAGEEGMTLAYYTSGEAAITIVLPNVTELSGQFPEGDQEAVWAALIGHEYGHHVQAVTGVLDVSYELESSAGSESESLEALRRTELQAECMGGIAVRGLGAFGDTEIDRVNRLLNGGEDLPTHGTSANRRDWYEQGADGSSLEACNTYGAPTAKVR